MAGRFLPFDIIAHDGTYPKPIMTVKNYTANMYLTYTAPHTFVVAGELELIIPPQVMEQHISTMRATGFEVEYHVSPNILICKN
jgi:predicted esterase